MFLFGGVSGESVEEQGLFLFWEVKLHEEDGLS